MGLTKVCSVDVRKQIVKRVNGHLRLRWGWGGGGGEKGGEKKVVLKRICGKKKVF